MTSPAPHARKEITRRDVRDLIDKVAGAGERAWQYQRDSGEPGGVKSAGLPRRPLSPP